MSGGQKTKESEQFLWSSGFPSWDSDEAEKVAAFQERLHTTGLVSSPFLKTPALRPHRSLLEHPALQLGQTRPLLSQLIEPWLSWL